MPALYIFQHFYIVRKQCIEIRKKGQKGGKGKKSFVFWLMLSLCICTSIKSNIHHRQRPLDLCYVISYTYFKLNYQNRKNVLVSWSNSILKYKEKSNVRTAFYSVENFHIANM